VILPQVRSLADAGLASDAASRRTAAFERCLAALGNPRQDAVCLFVPGRIEVLGKHTDYAGGRSLLCAAEQGFSLAVRPRTDGQVVVTSVEDGDQFVCALRESVQPVLGHWSNYPATVVRRVARNFPGARVGADITFLSDLPPAAGMSSSSALMIAVFAALDAVNHLDDSPEYQANIDTMLAFAGYAATIENGRTYGTLAGDRGVGTFGGSEDHTAILTCRPDRLARYAFAPVRFEADVALPREWVFVIAKSGVVAEKTGAARALYNGTSQRVADGLATWNRATGRTDETLDRAISSAPDARKRLLAILQASDVALYERAHHFCVESLDIIPAAFEALARGDMRTFGTRVDESQRAAEQWLGTQVAETIFLPARAREHGAVAASAFGAGFGGSVWALTTREQSADLMARLQADYAARFPEAATRAQYFVTRPGSCAFAVI
jgi:galactokinase